MRFVAIIEGMVLGDRRSTRTARPEKTQKKGEVR